jgi:protocatechuate 3,4-dioxygenase beta subunit
MRRTRSLQARLLVGFAGTVAALVVAVPAEGASPRSCGPGTVTHPTEAPNDSYRPGAPVRSVVARGHVLTGVIRSGTTCRGIGRAKLEFFQAGPSGQYSNGTTSWAYRATMFTKPDGSYRYESRFPGSYGTVRAHIHVRISAPGHRQLSTTYFPQIGSNSGRVSVVLDRA